MDCLPRPLEIKTGKGRLLSTLSSTHPYLHHPQGGWAEELLIDGEEDEEEAPDGSGGGGIEVRVEEEGSGLVAARGFSRLFSKLLAPTKEGEEKEKEEKEEEKILTHLRLDAWGRPSVGPLRIVLTPSPNATISDGEGGEGGVVGKEEEVLGAEWEAGAYASVSEREAALALEEAMSEVDREVEETLAARNGLEALVYRVKGEGGEEGRQVAEEIERWLEEGGEEEEEEGGSVGEYEEKREGLLAAMARDVEKGKEEEEKEKEEEKRIEEGKEKEEEKQEVEDEGIEVVFTVEGEEEGEKGKAEEGEGGESSRD